MDLIKNKRHNSTQTRSIRVRTVLASAALGALTLIGSSAYAQQRVGTDGRARDANNRVGSYGFNDASGGAQSPYIQNGVNNAIITGDVTGGKQFHGNVGYFDPGQFHGALPGSTFDAFNRQSTGVSTSGVVTNNAQETRVYLGDSRGVNAPSSFISQGAVGGYVPAPLTTGQSGSDARLGTPLNSSFGSGAISSNLFLPGGTTASTYVTASPLYGVKQLKADQSNTDSAQPDGLSQTPFSGRYDSSVTDRLGGLNKPFNSDLSAAPAAADGLGAIPNLSQRTMQGGLPGQTPVSNDSQDPSAGNGQTGPNGARPSGSNGPGANGPGTNGQGPNGQGTIGQGSLGNSAALNPAPSNGSIYNSSPTGAPLDGSKTSGPLPNSINTLQDQSSVYPKGNRLPPSAAYQRMLRNIQILNNNAPLTAQQRQQLTQFQINAEKAREAAKANPDGPNNVAPPADNTATATPFGKSPGDLGAKPGVAPAGTTPPKPGVGPVVPGQVPQQKERPKPITMTSFVDEQNKGTSDLLKKAEDLMKEGKFTSALEQYDLVEQTAPNNPFSLLGRANAELGASYYGLAESHLRQAFIADQALLLAQYDLNTFLGHDRLDYLVKDLKQIAQANPTQSRPVFLLAYIYYNTNDERHAAGFLDLADKRSGKTDAFYKLVHKYWELPDVSVDNSTPELNK